MTLGLPTQGQPANIGPNTEQISRQREPEADPSFGDSLGQWVRVKAQCPMVRSWSGQVLVRPQLTPKGRGNGIPITGRHPLCYHSLQEHRMSTGLCSSSDPSLGASATKRKKKKGPIFKEHHCCLSPSKTSSFGKSKVLAGGSRGRFSFSTTFQALAQPPDGGETLFIFQSEGKP